MLIAIFVRNFNDGYNIMVPVIVLLIQKHLY